MFAPRLFVLLALVAAASALRRAPAPSTAPAFWNIEVTASEVLAEAATGAPEPRAPLLKTATTKNAAAPGPSKRRRESADNEIDAAADDELDAVAVAANAFAQIAAGAQEIEAMTAEADDAATAIPELPTFLELHDEVPLEALPAEAVAPHGLVAVGDDAIFAAADSAASAASTAAAPVEPSEFSDLEAALEAAAESGTAVVVVDDAPASTEAVALAGEQYLFSFFVLPREAL